jgi:hypothetical protein
MFVNVAKVDKLTEEQRNSFMSRAFPLLCLMLMERSMPWKTRVRLTAPLYRMDG